MEIVKYKTLQICMQACMQLFRAGSACRQQFPVWQQVGFCVVMWLYVLRDVINLRNDQAEILNRGLNRLQQNPQDLHANLHADLQRLFRP